MTNCQNRPNFKCRVMFKLFVLLLIVSFINLNQGLEEYVAPKSVAYPFGDEVFNADITEEQVQEGSTTTGEIEDIKNIEIFCPNVTQDEENGLSEEEIPHNEDICQKCDVRPTVDKVGALVECFNCSDVSFVTLSQEDPSPSHILFLTTFLEIANYSSAVDM